MSILFTIKNLTSEDIFKRRGPEGREDLFFYLRHYSSVLAEDFYPFSFKRLLSRPTLIIFFHSNFWLLFICKLFSVRTLFFRLEDKTYDMASSIEFLMYLYDDVISLRSSCLLPDSVIPTRSYSSHNYGSLQPISLLDRDSPRQYLLSYIGSLPCTNNLAAFFSHPLRVRLRLISELSLYYSKHFSLYGSNRFFQRWSLFRTLVDQHSFKALRDCHQGPTEIKQSVLQNSIFNLIIENSFSKCFITEKIVDSFFVLTIPVFIGTSSVLDLFPDDLFYYFPPNTKASHIFKILSSVSQQEIKGMQSRIHLWCINNYRTFSPQYLAFNTLLRQKLLVSS